MIFKIGQSVSLKNSPYKGYVAGFANIINAYTGIMTTTYVVNMENNGFYDPLKVTYISCICCQEDILQEFDGRET